MGRYGSFLEIKVYASNHLFPGTAECYSTREEIREFGEMIEGYPKLIDHEVHFTTYSSEDSSYFEVNFRCKDKIGHVLARVKIAHIETYSDSSKEEYMSEFDIEIEPNRIDIFSKSLIKLSEADIGEHTAILHN